MSNPNLEPPAGAASSAIAQKYERSPFAWWTWAALGLLFLLIYGWGDNSLTPGSEGKSTIGFLLSRWRHDESVTHGWLVIPIAAAVTWYKREKLRRLPLSSHKGGLALIALALLFHLTERLLDLNGPSPVSLPILAAGAVWYLCGTAWLRELAFPLAYLLFFVPIPGEFSTLVTHPLRLLATNGSAAIVSKLGVSPIVSGMNMEFGQPHGSDYVRLVVADPCSGIHSLMAIKALHAITAYLSRMKLGWKWVLFWCALPITLTANVLRMTLIILVCAYVNKDFGLTLFHDYSPYVLFLFVFLILVSLGRLMEKLTGGLPWWEARRAQEQQALASQAAAPDWRRIGPAPSRTPIGVLLALGCAANLFLMSRPPVQALSADVTALPLQAGAWTGQDIREDAETLKQQEADSYVHRFYRRPDGQNVELLLIYRRYGRKEFYHRPDRCYPSGGFNILKKGMTTLPWAGREDPAVYLLADGSNVTRGDGSKGVPMTTCTYFFVSGSRSESNVMRHQLWMALERLMPNKNGWTMVRLSSYRITSDDDALAAQKEFMQEMGPEILKVVTTDPETAGNAGS